MTTQLSFVHYQWREAQDRLARARKLHRPTKALIRETAYWAAQCLKVELTEDARDAA